jgi:hypothetical protein
VSYVHQQPQENAMTTDAQSPGDLIAERHVESLFHGLRQRLALIRKLAINAQDLPFRRDQGMGSIESGSSAALRAAAIVADWRAYLPEDCVAAMIKDEWHWST